MCARPIGLDCGGIWKPQAINPVLRVTEYSPGQFFKPHFDVRMRDGDGYPTYSSSI